MSLTKRQIHILSAIINYVEVKNYPPTTRELGKIVGLKSTSTTHGHLEKLRKLGYVDWEESKPRTLRILRGVS